MKVALSIEVTDQQRLAITGTKRLATRDEVRTYLNNCLHSLTELALPGTSLDEALRKLTELDSPGTTGPSPPPLSDEVPGESTPYDPFARMKLDAKTRKAIEKLRKAGHPDNYIRGFLGLNTRVKKE